MSFTNSESNTVVECQYDSMGRRAFKKVTINGSVTLHQRYIYRGYLQIACIDLTRSHHPVMWLVTWDPTQSPRGLGGGLDKPRSEFAPQGRGGNGVPVSQPVATRPLAIRINGTWYTYGWDLTKNVCELYSTEGRITTSYTYSPFGSVTATGSHTQPIQWSSEMWDSELGLVYYNWRYYNSIIGRWISYDPANYLDLYFYLNPTWEWDNLGLRPDINYLSKAFKKDVLSEFDSAEVYINEPSYFVITAHGTAHFITDSDNNLMSPLELANKMIEAGYRFDKTVKLLACNTGKLKKWFCSAISKSSVFDMEKIISTY